MLVDANVLLDVTTDNQAWRAWSLAALDDAALDGPLCINPVIYAEVSVGFTRRAELDGFLNDADIAVLETPREALFQAARAHQRYRAAGGTKPAVLPDFFIGAHAQHLGVPLLTRDVKRYRTFFPTVALIAPTPGR